MYGRFFFPSVLCYDVFVLASCIFNVFDIYISSNIKYIKYKVNLKILHYFNVPISRVNIMLMLFKRILSTNIIFNAHNCINIIP